MYSQTKHTSISLYKPGQHVWLLTKLWQPQVLEVQWIGLFEVQEVLYNACQLCLPLMLKIHPVVNVVFLKPVSTLMPSNSPRVVLANSQDMADKE